MTQIDPIASDIAKINQCLSIVNKNIEKVKKILKFISDYCLTICLEKAKILEQTIEMYKKELAINVTDDAYFNKKNKIFDDFLIQIKYFNNLNLTIKEKCDQITLINKNSNSYIYHYFQKDVNTLMTNKISNINKDKDSEININNNNNNNKINENINFLETDEDRGNNFYSDEFSGNKENNIIINDNNNNKSNSLNEYQRLERQNKEITEKILNSFNFVIKSIIFKTNYLLKKERERQIKDYNDKDIRNVDYPILKNNKDFWSDKIFIENINKKLENEFSIKNNNEIIDNSIIFKDPLDKKIINEIKNIFNEPKLGKVITSFFDWDFFNLSDEEENKGSNNIAEENIIIKNDLDLDGFLKNTSGEYLNAFNKKKRDLESLLKNSYIIEEDNKISCLDNGQIKEKSMKKNFLGIIELCYLIKSLKEKNFKRKNLIEDIIIKKLRNNILMGPEPSIKYLFTDFFITTEKFSKISLKEIIYDYPRVYELYYFKILIDDLLYKECQIQNFIDYRGNYITRTKGYMLRKFKDIRPRNGWIGIGIKIDEKCIDNDEWANAFYAIGKSMSSDEIKKNLIKYLKDGLDNETIRDEFKDNNKEDIIKNGDIKFLDQDIKKIENNCGIISFNKVSYRIALMVKIKSTKLKESENINIFKNEDIKIDTILLKRLN